MQYHLGLFFAGCVAVALLFGLFTMAFAPVLWDGVLQGKPVSELGAAAFGLDPTKVVTVEKIAPEVRVQIARSLTSWPSLLLVLPLLAFAALLYYYYVWILQKVNQGLRLDLVDRLQALSLRFHQDNRIGDAIYRTYQDSAMVTQLLNVLFLRPIGALLQFTGMMLLVAVFTPGLALLLLFAWPLVLVLGAVFSRRLRSRFRRAREANSDLTSRIQESVGGIKVLKAYGLEDFERERFETSSMHAFAEAFRARSMLALFGVSVFWVLGGFLIVSTFWSTLFTRSGGSLWLYEQVVGTSMGDVLLAAGFSIWALGWYNLFKLVFSRGTGSINGLYKVWGRAQDIVIGLDRVFEILELEPEVSDLADAIPLPPLQTSIVFRNLGFAYQPDRPVLRDVSFEAPIGTITALVGPTGSGKSTLMALLLRLFDPDRGSIEIDGCDLRRFLVRSLRQKISIALQENVLFGTTIRENIRYAVPDANDERVREVARIACVDEFVEGLPEGYDTVLGERGARLSTGQRQRITIARALMKDAPILILDEPTSALDAETERRLILNLSEWGRDRNVFLITHRLSTIRMADQIAYLDGGQIVEVGSHEALMDRPDAAYRRLVESEQRSSGR
ncbi:MAG: ABC transporter ATP-binding protein [bacterium]|nr:ABC transporter ATP-binding protein [bacterium]